MPSELETSMESLIKVFHRYADSDGDGKTLSRKELRKLMETELPNFLKVEICLSCPVNLQHAIYSSIHPLSKPLILLSGSQGCWSLSQQSLGGRRGDTQDRPPGHHRATYSVDFEEFVSLVVGLSVACEQCYRLHMKAAKH
ncbi:protein S100-A10b [Lampris incognitus]|uniref:protein S100-A10b n=1 Tax=Lampris incognitus TaxID=2546036 RepID=UPI0024B4B49F|nr:protein S100-A10b [Lampris incognitus]